MASKILFNETSPSVDVVLKFMGITIPAGGTYELQVEEYAMWARDDSVAEISPFLTSGDLKLEFETLPLNDEAAIECLKYPDTANSIKFGLTLGLGSRVFTSAMLGGKSSVQRAIEFSFPRVDQDSSLKALTTRRFNFTGNVNVIVDLENPHKATIDIGNGSGGLEGRVIDFAFGNVGNTQNKWLEFASSSAASNVDPYIAPFDGNLAALTFVNTKDGADVNIELYKNGVIWFTWEIRDKRHAFKTDAMPEGILQGDRISVFARKITGGTNQNPFTPIIEVIFQVSTAPIGEGGASSGV